MCSRLVSRYRKRLSTTMTDKLQQCNAGAGSEGRLVGSDSASRKMSQASEKELELDEEVQAVLEQPRGLPVIAEARSNTQSPAVGGRTRCATSPTNMQQCASNTGSRCSSPFATSQARGTNGAAARQRVSSLSGRPTRKNRESVLLALDGHDTSGTLV